MTHRDGLPMLSARSVSRGGAGHREPHGTLSAPGPKSPRPQDWGKPPFRASLRPVGGTIPMGHYHRSLV